MSFFHGSLDGGGGGDGASTLLSRQLAKSGLLSGGFLTTGTSPTTQLDMTAMTGIILNQVDPTAPTLTEVAVDAFTDYNVLNLATNGTFFIVFDKDGVRSEISFAALTTADRKANIVVGSYSVFNSLIINVNTSPGNLGYDGIDTSHNFIRDIIGPSNISGNLISANGANLKLDNTGGIVLVLGSNFRTGGGTITPDETTILPGTEIQFFRSFRDSSLQTLIPDGPQVDEINPANYDDGSGTLASVGMNNYTIQVLYVTREVIFIAYGQEVFNNLASAEDALIHGSLQYDEVDVAASSVQRLFLVVKNNVSDLTNTSDAAFFDAPRFRMGGGAVAGGTIPGINAPGGANTNVQFNDSGLFGGSSDFTWDGTDVGIDADSGYKIGSALIFKRLDGTFSLDDSLYIGAPTTLPVGNTNVLISSNGFSPSITGLIGSTIIGYNTGQALTVHSSLTAVGDEALLALNAGSNHSVFGSQGLESLTSGASDSAFGANAGGSLASGNDNCIFGADGGNENMNAILLSGSNNILMGAKTSIPNNVSGIISDFMNVGNTLVGSLALGSLAIQPATAQFVDHDSAVSLDFRSTTQAIRLNRLNNSEESSLTKTNGMLWYNLQTHRYTGMVNGVLQRFVTENP